MPLWFLLFFSPMSWELVLEPGGGMEGAWVPLSLQWKFTVSFFSKQPFVLAAHYQAGLSAGAMAHTRAGPSSALQICPAISKLLSLRNPSGTGVTHRGGREPPRMFALETCLENCIFLFCISQLIVSFLGTEYFKSPGYCTWAVGTVRLKSGGKIKI